MQPGVVLDELRDAAERHHLTFGPDPATHSRCTLGGMIGNNSCGVHSVIGGRDRPTTSSRSTSSLYDGTAACTVGATSDDELEQIIARGRPARRDLRRLRDLRDRYGDAGRASASRRSRAASPATTSTAAARAGFNLARGAGRHRGDLRLVLEARCSSSPARRTARWSCSATRTLPARPTRCRVMRARPDRAGGLRPPPGRRTSARKGSQATHLTCCPRARLAAGRVRRRTPRTRPISEARIAMR